jgi:hypothetical protein
MSDHEHAIPTPPEPPVRITVELISRDVMLPWDTRDALLAALGEDPRGDDGLARATRKAIEDIPATSPVLLTLEHKMFLLRVLREWSEAAGGYDVMPPGLFELRNALMDELRDAEQGPAATRTDALVGSQDPGSDIV